MLTTEEWEKINAFNAEISIMKITAKTRKLILQKLQLLISFDFGAFFLTSISESSIDISIHDIIYISSFNKEYENNIIQTLMNLKELDYLKWIIYEKDSVIVRESDIITPELKIKNSFFSARNPLNLDFNISLSVNYDGLCLGGLSLYRTTDNEDFSKKELYMLQMIEPYLKAILYRDYKLQRRNHLSSKRRRLAEVYGLTERELELLELIVKGKENQEISDELHISINTVKKHVNNILSKVQLKNKYQLIKLLIDEGYNL